MKIVNTLNETLNGNYPSLFGEVVTSDIYRLRTLDFVPDVVIDLGANVGAFTRFARELFPNALIVSVEPDKENFHHLVKFTPPENIIFINKAIGLGKVWRGVTAANGSGATYLSSGLGYPEKEMGGATMEPSELETIMPDELIKAYVKNGQKILIKIDIEGNEHTIFTHQPSMEAIKKAEYICMEVHFYALNGGLTDDVNEGTMRALKHFEATHNIELDNVNFYARKKP
jgi:FkbM family methyltransferase